MDYEGIQKNIGKAIVLISRCQYVIGLVKKAAEQIELKKYFSALKVDLMHVVCFAQLFVGR